MNAPETWDGYAETGTKIINRSEEALIGSLSGPQSEWEINRAALDVKNRRALVAGMEKLANTLDRNSEALARTLHEDYKATGRLYKYGLILTGVLALAAIGQIYVMFHTGKDRTTEYPLTVEMRRSEE